MLSLSHLVSGGLITNYYCSSECKHCLCRSSPRWPNDYISPVVIRENLEIIHGLGCNTIHIGGGEPLLKPEGVASVLETANDTGIRIEYVETNSSWYRNDKSACDTLERLVAMGLSTLLVSISPFHNEYIPFYKVKGVLEASQKVGLSVFPWIKDFISDINTLDETKTHSLEEYQQLFEKNYYEHILQKYWISMGGRALETFRRFLKRKQISELLSESTGGCFELAEVGHFHIDLYGNYVPGLCAGLSVWKEDLKYSLTREEYPIISQLYDTGIGEFFQYASENYGFKPATLYYASKCELCYEIRCFLVVEKRVKSKELQPYGHYYYG